jgi:hypothetical protein
MISYIEKIVMDPYPIRTAYIKLVKKLQLFDYEHRVRIGAVERPHYGYCLYQGCLLAKKLGLSRVSVIEFGVAGGGGLVNLEYHAGEISKALSIDIEIYGFDTGEGLPSPIDYRDLPYHWQAGFFKMDVKKLQSRLTKSVLVFGDINQTVQHFFEKFQPAPIACAVIDLDYYSSTVAALRLFARDNYNHMLPRIFCYFDDVGGTEVELFSDYTGERFAIREFNTANANMKFSPAYYLLGHKVVPPWYNNIFILHAFDHHQYNQLISEDDKQLALT